MAVTSLAQAIAADPAIFSRGASLEEAIVKLRSLPGIGEWTAQYIAMRELREPDAFPAADIGLLRAMADGDGRRPSPPELLLRSRAMAAVARLCGVASVGRRHCASSLVREKPMSAKPPETFNLDRLQTPIGTALLVTDADGVLRALDWEELRAAHEGTAAAAIWRGGFARTRGLPKELRAALTAYFKGDLDRLNTIKWRVAGTPFQQKVWTALPRIPAGTTMSYGALAAKLNAPKAMRAVGHANGSNPISVVVPCHRLIGANGSLVKYGGGLERKRWLLEHEGVVLKP